MNGEIKYLKCSIIFITIIGILFYNFIHLEKSAEIQTIENQISKTKNEIILIHNFKTAHKNIDDEIAILAERHFRVIELFPEKSKEEKIIEYFRESAKKHQLEILNITSDDTKNNENTDNNKNFFTTDFNVKIRGDYFNILDFMFALYNNNNFFNIENMDLKNEHGILTLNLKINCYYSKRDKGEKS